MKIFPLCFEKTTSHSPVKNRILQCITAIVAIIVPIFFLIISIIGCFVSSQFFLSNLILNTVMSLVLFILGLNYLIDQHRFSDDGKRFSREIASRDREIVIRNQEIESLKEHALRYQAQIVDLETETTRLNKYVSVLEKENTIYAQKYFAELESREQYEKHVCLLSKRLQDTIRFYNRRRRT